MQDHSFHTQAVFEINKQVAKLETSLENIEKRLEKVEAKLDSVSNDLNAMKTTLDTLKPIAKSVAVAIWGFVASVGALGLTMLGYWLKKRYGL